MNLNWKEFNRQLSEELIIRIPRYPLSNQKFAIRNGWWFLIGLVVLLCINVVKRPPDVSMTWMSSGIVGCETKERNATDYIYNQIKAVVNTRSNMTSGKTLSNNNMSLQFNQNSIVGSRNRCAEIALELGDYELARKLSMALRYNLEIAQHKHYFPREFSSNMLKTTRYMLSKSTSNGSLLSSALYYQYQLSGEWNEEWENNLKVVDPSNGILDFADDQIN